jgi:glycosyltransferase involved in cell wall biosynthesis
VLVALSLCLKFCYATRMGKKLKGVVSLYSNSPDQPTGYGQQARYLVDRLKRSGLEVAALSNYGLEGVKRELETPYGSIPHFARGMDMYSNDSAPIDHANFSNQFPGLPNRLITLYDVWVLKNAAFDKMPIMSWTPLDHITLPPLVENWLRKPNVTPIAMAPHGVRQMEAKGIECEYAPHAIDTKTIKPTFEIDGQPIEEHMKTKDRFVVGCVAANKSSGLLHRKAYSENILAFSIFKKRHPDAVLYLHTEPMSPAGWNLPSLLEGCGIDKESVIFPNPLSYKYGIPQEHLAAYYTGMDVMLATSYGEGFGIPTVEAQACGTRVIGSNWAATPDLVAEDGWVVDGQPQWDSGQNAWWQIPNVPAIVEALEQAYSKGKGRSQVAIDFAKDFDVETVWDKYWMPILKKVF